MVIFLMLQKYFPEEPPLEVVHIVIQLPPEPSLVEGGLDLPRVEAEHDTYDDLIDYLGASRYVLDVPSTVSKPSDVPNVSMHRTIAS